MKRARILSGWIGDGLSKETAFRSPITEDYPHTFHVDRQQTGTRTVIAEGVTIEVPVYEDTLVVDQEGVCSYVDVTNQPSGNIIPSPNLCVIEVVCDDSVLTAIRADSTYCILWSEDIVTDEALTSLDALSVTTQNQTLTADSINPIVSFLQAKGIDVEHTSDTVSNGMTVKEYEAQVTSYLRTLPKAV